MMSDLYQVGERDVMELGQVYVDHVLAMTREGLHSKADIAAELAHRDIRIAELEDLETTYVKWVNGLEEKVAELEQENASLKEQLAYSRETNLMLDDHYGAQIEQLQAQVDQLTRFIHKEIGIPPPPQGESDEG